MLSISVAMSVGATVVLCLPSLPPVVAVCLAAVLGVAGLLHRRTRWLATAVLGGCWFAHAAGQVLDDRLAPSLSGQDHSVLLQIIDFPKVSEGYVQFSAAPVDAPELPRRLRLGWYNAPAELANGETWQLKLRLRRPRGFVNPGGFDYEGWLFRSRIGATGYVLTSSGNKRVHPAPERGIDELRRKMLRRIESLLPRDDARGVLRAISLGERNEISSAQWRVYATTGTSHLVAISGLHIGLAAGGAFLLGWMLFAPFLRVGNARDIAAIASVALAGAYAALSGFAIPAQRAVMMLCGIALLGLLRRRVAPAEMLGTAAVVVFIADPLALLAPGFQLSFLAVAILIRVARSAANQEASPDVPRYRRWINSALQLTRLQLSLLFGMLALTVAIFGRVAWLAPLVNILVLPVFSLVTVPAALLGLALDGLAAPIGDVLLRTAWHSLRLMLLLINAAAELPNASLEPALSGRMVLLVAAPTVLWVLLPPGWPGRGTALVALLATVMYRPPAPPESCVDVTLFDVGQGLALLLRSSRHTLLYDTGPSWRSGGSAAKLVVSPYLRRHGIDRLDVVVISHADLDHAGGLAEIQASFEIGDLLSGESLETGGRPCDARQHWQTDGVSFRVLHPAADAAWHGNNASCVLEVRVGGHKLLILGDIEAAAERELLNRGVLSPVDMLTVPHHGSKTSSRREFVDAVHPAIALVAAGHANRWGFPKPTIVQRWQASGATVLTTADNGALTARWCAGEARPAVVGERSARRRLWHD